MVRTKSSAPSAPAAWARSIARAIRVSIAPWRSRSSPARSRPTRNREQRFEHEARVIAALNHPHICTLFDVGRHGELDYLVLEHLEGETLADRLRRSPALPVDDAHRHGDPDRRRARPRAPRRHRPSRSEAGQRDAGAQRRARPTSSCSTSDSRPERPRRVRSCPTRTLAATTGAVDGGDAAAESRTGCDAGFVGTVAGHVARAARRQARAINAPTSLPSAACSTRCSPAARRSKAASVVTAIAAITSSEPPPIDALQAHPLLDHVMRRCLEKDRERRWQNIGDVTGELRWVAEPSAIVVRRRIAFERRVGMATGIARSSSRSPRLRRAPPRADREPPASCRRCASRSPRRRPTIHQWRCRRTARRSPSSRTRTGCRCCGFARSMPREPRARWNRGRQLSVLVAGRTHDRLLRGQQVEANRHRRQARRSWSPTRPNARGGALERRWGHSVYAGRQHRSCASRRAEAPSNASRQPNAIAGPLTAGPQFLPDGKRFLFSSTLGTPGDERRLHRLARQDAASSRDGGRQHWPLRRARQIADDAAGRASGVPLRHRHLEWCKGEPAVIAAGIRPRRGSASIATSNTGVLAYRPAPSQRRQLVWVNRGGEPCSAGWRRRCDDIGSPELSADEQSVVVFRHPTGDNDIWVIELAATWPHRVTDGPPRRRASDAGIPTERTLSSTRKAARTGRRSRAGRRNGCSHREARHGAGLDARPGVRAAQTRHRQDRRSRGRLDEGRASRGDCRTVAERRDGRTVLAGRQVDRVCLQRERPGRSVRSVVSRRARAHAGLH